ncbi:hypothetical protein AAL_05944 [Moelleriella libera RCEF 2490]|uniref:Uncharacterized protein n=1 Tax=Moelleriella libera RCEF 2490 TaxID=1081109 RepID=A0A167ZNS5_9HYPO|nr:hypothetical protein AAL_05944 [Moelleriella libera RCEF 2490]
MYLCKVGGVAPAFNIKNDMDGRIATRLEIIWQSLSPTWTRSTQVAFEEMALDSGVTRTTCHLHAHKLFRRIGGRSPTMLEYIVLGNLFGSHVLSRSPKFSDFIRRFQAPWYNDPVITHQYRNEVFPTLTIPATTQPIDDRGGPSAASTAPVDESLTSETSQEALVAENLGCPNERESQDAAQSPDLCKREGEATEGPQRAQKHRQTMADRIAALERQRDVMSEEIRALRQLLDENDQRDSMAEEIDKLRRLVGEVNGTFDMIANSLLYDRA